MIFLLFAVKNPIIVITFIIKASEFSIIYLKFTWYFDRCVVKPAFF